MNLLFRPMNRTAKDIAAIIIQLYPVLPQIIFFNIHPINRTAMDITAKLLSALSFAVGFNQQITDKLTQSFILSKPYFLIKISASCSHVIFL
jgi:hypothetical protein